MGRPPSRLRATLLWIHRWVGLTVGSVFVVVALSGSLLLFQPFFFQWTHGSMIPAGLSPEIGSIDRWVDQSRAAAPGLTGPIAIWGPHVDHNVSDAGMVVYAGKPPGGLGHMGIVGVLVAPATGDVLGVVDIDRSAAYAPIFLHRDLWAGAIGRVINGILAGGVAVLLLVGIYLWCPPPSAVWRKLSIRPWRTTLRRARPFHEWFGIWSAAMLLVLSITGLALVQPGWVAPALTVVVGPKGEDSPGPPCAGQAIGFQAAVEKAHVLAPTGSLTKLVPLDFTPFSTRRWQIVFAVPGTRSSLQDTHVHADLSCGTVVLESTAATRTARHAADIWVEGLHDGSAFGSAGEILVSLAGLVPVALAWSGVLMWWRGRRSGKRTREIAAA